MTCYAGGHDTKDCPHPLKLNALSVDLAKVLYYASSELYGWQVAWEAATPTRKAALIDKAADVLRALEPAQEPPSLFEQIAAVARAEASRVLAFPDTVVGVITPEVPYGVDPRD